MRPLRSAAAAAFGVVLVTGCASGESPASSYLAEFHSAERRLETFPAVTEAMPQLDLGAAYGLQARIVASRIARGDAIAGFKGGLMSAKSMSARRVNEPLVGVLFASGALDSGAEVSFCDYRRAALELKLGYIFAAPVDQPLASIEDLKARVRVVQPVVELPDIAYRDGETYGAVDMVAANISSAKYVGGTPSDPAAADLDGLTVTLHRDGAPVVRGLGRESLDGQWSSLLTVVNLVIRHGGRVRPGQLVLTGKIGDKFTLTAGAYRADYGPLGDVRFQAKACPDA